MKKTVSIIAISCMALLAGCSDQGAEPATDSATQQPAPQTAAAHPEGHTQEHSADHPAMPGHPPSQSAPANQHQAKVVSVTHAAGYTYMEVEFDGQIGRAHV